MRGAARDHGAVDMVARDEGAVLRGQAERSCTRVMTPEVTAGNRMGWPDGWHAHVDDGLVRQKDQGMEKQRVPEPWNRLRNRKRFCLGA